MTRPIPPKPPENRTRWRMSCYRCGEHHETRPYGPSGAHVCAWCAFDSPASTAVTRAAFAARLTSSPQVLTEVGPQALPANLDKQGIN